jgi:chromosome segregation ATPase
MARTTHLLERIEMSVKGRVKEDLHAGKPWDVIYKRYRSKSQIYEGLTDWFEDVKGEITAKQDEAAGLDAKIEDLTSKVKGASTEHAGLLEKNEDLKEKCAQLSENVSSLEQRKATLDTHVNNLTSRIDELASRGVTLETVEKIHTAQFESGEDLLGRVQTAQAHARLQEDEEKLRVEKEKLEGTVNSLEETVKGLQEKVTSAENKLDTLRDETAIYGTAVDVVKRLFRTGYSTKDITHLSEGLKTMGIKDDPQASLKRLVKGLEKAKSLIVLNEQIKEAEAELKAIQRDLNAAKAELKSMNDTTLKTIGDARETAVTEIEKTGDEVTAEMRGVLAELREDVKGWGEIQREAGKLQGDIENAQNFMAFMQEDEVLEMAPPSFASALMDRIRLWINKKHSQVRVAPSKEAHAKDDSLITWKKYSLVALAEFVHEALLELGKPSLQTPPSTAPSP